jgi:hypothetical protein
MYKLMRCRNISVIVLESGWIPAAGGRDNAVQAQMERHLAVVVGVVPDHHGGQTEARVRAGIQLVGHLSDVLSCNMDDTTGDIQIGFGPPAETGTTGRCSCFADLMPEYRVSSIYRLAAESASCRPDGTTEVLR